MEFTFGIVTAGFNESFVSEIIQSIHSQNIPNYEIIIVGNSMVQSHSTRRIPFDETVKPGWITRKKNIIANEAKYENIVLMHDYIKLCGGWYSGFLEFGNNFSFCCSKILYKNGARARDFSLFPFELPGSFKERALFPYSYKQSNEINKLMYISGSYYIIKKNIALKYPLNEDLYWGTGEDVELSQRLSMDNIRIECNSKSCVQLLKEKAPCPWEQEMNECDISLLETIPLSIIESYAQKQRVYLKDVTYRSFNIIL